MTKPITAVWPGRPYPRGAYWDGEGVNFAIFSEHAERSSCCLFDAKGKIEVQRVELTERSVLSGTAIYRDRPGCFMVSGCTDLTFRRKGHRQSHKLLIETLCERYSRNAALERRPFWFKHRQQARRSSFSRRDNASVMPKCRVIDQTFAWEMINPPTFTGQDMVIYELHVKGFTMQHPDILPQFRGTYAGLAMAPAIEHLKSLG